MNVFYSASAQIPPAAEFAASWIDAWNAHDLPRILTHYCEDVVLYSPLIARVQNGKKGYLTGRSAIADYWAAGLQKFPTLHFSLINTLKGVDSLMIYYRGIHQQTTAEVFWFDEQGRVHRAAVYYPEELSL